MNATQFFKESAGFDRVLRAMFEVYSHHGRAFGAVRLAAPGREEEAALSVFFKRDYYNQALIRISLADFERQMQKNFPESSLGGVLSEYTGETVEGRVANSKSTFVSAILAEENFHETPADNWLKEISTQSRRAYHALAKQFQSDPDTVMNMVRTVAQALNNIGSITDEKLTPLTEFSEKHAGAPDALDFSEPHGKLFLKALACRLKQPVPIQTQDCITLHLRAGLLSCGMLSNVTTLGLLDGDNAHALTLENVDSIQEISARRAYIIEEPQIFAAIAAKRTDYAVIHPASPTDAAFLYLLTKLRAAKIPMYYAGNLCIKSLEAADTVCTEFGAAPWRYSREDYALAVARESSPFPVGKKIPQLHNEELASLLSYMRKVGESASRMPLVQLMKEDLSK